MECPKCGSKTKIVQTHNDTEAVIEKCTVPPMPSAEGFDKYEVRMGHKVVTRPIIKRKHKCPQCNCYFWTKETFLCWTETETKKIVMDELKSKMQDFDDTDCVYCIPPENIKIKFNRGGESNDQCSSNL